MNNEELRIGINLYCERDLSMDKVQQIVASFRRILHMSTGYTNASKAVRSEYNKIVDILTTYGQINDSRGIQRALRGIIELLFSNAKGEMIDFALGSIKEVKHG